MADFIPRFEEPSDSLIIDNLLAIVKRDMKPALDHYFPPAAEGAPLLDDSVLRPVGATVLHIDGFTTKPEAGDVFTIAGDFQLYEVIDATDLVGTDSDVTFQPGLKVAIPAVDGNEVVTFGFPDFAQRTVGEFITIRLPTFAISPKGNTPIESDDASFVAENLKLNLLMGVGHSDAPTVTRLATKYVRALKSVLRTADKDDYTAGFPANTIFALNVEVAYEYGLIGKNANAALGYEKMVHVELTLKFNER